MKSKITILTLLFFIAVLLPESVRAEEPDPDPVPTAAELLQNEGEPEFSEITYPTRNDVVAAISDFIQNPAHASGPHALTVDNPAAPDALRVLRLGNRIILEFEVYETLVPDVEQISYEYQGQPTQPQWVTGTRTDALGDTRAQQLKTLLDNAEIEYMDLWFVNYGRYEGWNNELRAYYHAIHARLDADNPSTIGIIMNIADTILQFDYTQTTQGYLSVNGEE
jgi:hypothetical protein